MSSNSVSTENTPGLHEGGSSQSAVGYDASMTSGQQNPLVASQGVRYGKAFYPSAAGAKQVGSAGSASNQMDYRAGNANDNPAGPQQQGAGPNAQGRNGAHRLM